MQIINIKFPVCLRFLKISLDHQMQGAFKNMLLMTCNHCNHVSNKLNCKFWDVSFTEYRPIKQSANVNTKCNSSYLFIIMPVFTKYWTFYPCNSFTRVLFFFFPSFVYLNVHINKPLFLLKSHNYVHQYLIF